MCVFVFVGHTTKALFAHPSSQFGRSDGAMRIADSPLPSAAIASDQRGQRALQECWRSAPALDYLALQDNNIGAVGEGRLRASWRGQASGLPL